MSIFEVLVTANNLKHLISTSPGVYSVIRERNDVARCFELVGQVRSIDTAQFLMKEVAHKYPNDCVYVYCDKFQIDEILR